MWMKGAKRGTWRTGELEMTLVGARLSSAHCGSLRSTACDSP